MAQTLTKNEKAILSGLAICVVGLGFFFKQLSFVNNKSYGQISASQIDYKMGKADDQAALYDLNGRQIDREYTSDDEETVTKPRALAEVKSKEAAKKTDLKKQTQKSNSPNFAMLKKTENEQEKKKKALEAQARAQAVIQNNTQSPVNKSNVTQNNYYAAQAVAQIQNQEGTVQNQETKNKKSFDQYRQEFYAKASKEIVQDIVNAYKKNEITRDQFYSLQNEALNQKDQKYVGLALYALRLTPSADSFALLAMYQPSASSTYQEYIQAALVTYNQSQYITSLQVALKSKQKTVVMKALEIIKYGLTEIKNGNTALLVDSRNRRDTQFTGYSVQNYSSFVAVINQVIQTGSPDSDTLNSLETVRTLINDNSVNVAAN